MRRFEVDRAHLSHDLLANCFLGLLQPGYDEQLSERDIVLKAARGDRESLEAIEPALATWRKTICPSLDEFIQAIRTSYGFETSKAWDKKVLAVRSASIAISQFQPPLREVSPAACATRVQNFWDACDSLRVFLASLRSSFSTFFPRWNPELLRHSGSPSTNGCA